MKTRRGKKPDGGPPRRTRPPESTGAEAGFLDEAWDQQRALTFHLVGGESLRGTVVEHDRKMLRIRAEGGPPRVIRRSQIRLIEDGPA